MTVALGNERPNRDLAVSDLLVDDVVFVDDVVNFEFKLTGHGFADKVVEVVLREKSNPAPLAKTTVTVGADGVAKKVILPYRPTAVGEFEYVVEVPGQPDEVQSDNNHLEHLVSVCKDQIHVLLAQAYPNYEFRYLKHLIGARQHDRAAHDFAGVRSRLCRDRSIGFACVPRATRRPVQIRRRDFR